MIEGDPTQEKLTQLERGIQLKGYVTLPCKARLIPSPDLPPRPKPVTPHGPTAWLEIKLREGKKRQIRHMTAAVGLFTLRLVRVAIGRIRLGNLAAGEWRGTDPTGACFAEFTLSLSKCSQHLHLHAGASVTSWHEQYNYFMPRHFTYIALVLVSVTFATLSRTSTSKAESVTQPLEAGSPFDLINAVNALRISYGLAPYTINSILMYTAQAQADFMAATENVTHTGPGGIGLTDRLLAAGYPLAGDLSAGGFRAENITSGNENRTAQSAVDGWTGDAPHLNTMISPNLSEIGAGVAISNGRVYYVIDCALPTTGGVPQVSTSASGSGSTVPAREAPISVALVSTPNSSGDVIHEVRPGQSLWQIAIAYEVKIDDIKRLNNLFDNNIYPGNKLLIKQDVILPTTSLTEMPTNEPAVTPTTIAESPTPTLLPTVTILFSTEAVSSTSVDDNSIMGIAMGIIVLALLGGGVFTWLGSKKKTDS